MSTATRTRPLLVLALAAVLGLLGVAAPAWADGPPPQLSIRVDDGQTDARSGSTLRYAITLTNLGTKPVRDLAVNQTLPPGTTLASVEDGGSRGKGAARWTVDLPAGKTVTLRTSVKVGTKLPPDLFRLATVACAATSAKAAPLVCGSDSDQLPAGAAAAQEQRHLENAAADQRPAWLVPVGISAGALLLLAALVGAGVRLKRRGQTPGRRSLVPHEPS